MSATRTHLRHSKQLLLKSQRARQGLVGFIITVWKWGISICLWQHLKAPNRQLWNHEVWFIAHCHQKSVSPILNLGFNTPHSSPSLGFNAVWGWDGASEYRVLKPRARSRFVTLEGSCIAEISSVNSSRSTFKSSICSIWRDQSESLEEKQALATAMVWLWQKHWGHSVEAAVMQLY